MKKAITFFFIICFHFSGIAEIKTYPIEKIKVFEKGKEDTQLGYLPESEIAGIPLWPTTFLITDTHIYICDAVNMCIKVYTPDFQFIKKITNEEIRFSLRVPYSIREDFENNLYYFSYNNVGLNKIKDNGERIYFNTGSKYFDTEVINNFNFYIIEDYVFYYKNDMNRGQFLINVLDTNGNLISDIYSAIDKVQKDSLLAAKDKGVLYDYETINALNRTRTVLVLADGIKSNDFDKHRQVLEIITRTIKDKALEDKIDPDQFNDFSKGFLGYDGKRNSYWSVYPYRQTEDLRLLVCNKYGAILDSFTFSHIKDTIVFAIAPDGDIYFQMPEEKKNLVFYRVKNIWDTDAPAAITSQPVAPKTISLTASTFIDYKSMYIPEKAFDDDPKTAWLEAANGAGIGESITVQFDKPVTVDTIEIMPGYFDTKWWKNNNRVKKMTIKLNDKEITATFQDIMKAQRVKLKAPQNCTTIQFIIDEVYAGKDNDTAIAEIALYNNGKKIKVNQ